MLAPELEATELVLESVVSILESTVLALESVVFILESTVLALESTASVLESTVPTLELSVSSLDSAVHESVVLTVEPIEVPELSVLGVVELDGFLSPHEQINTSERSRVKDKVKSFFIVFTDESTC